MKNKVSALISERDSIFDEILLNECSVAKYYKKVKKEILNYLIYSFNRNLIYFLSR